jgi:hypothetical protein
MYHTSRQNIQILGKLNFYNFSESCYNDSMTKDTQPDLEAAIEAAEAQQAAELAALDAETLSAE